MFRILIFSIWFAFHPVHVTLTSIDYIPEKGTYNVFVRMYFDDFLLDCKLSGNAVRKEEFSPSDSLSKNIMQQYLRDKVVIRVNDKQLFAKLNDLDLADNEVNINLEYSYGKKPEIISVKNLIMTGLYADQSNMIILKVNDFEEGVKLTSDMIEQTFKLK